MKNSIPARAFISKLWTLVEAHSTNNFICWSQSGCSFVVHDAQRFSREVLPLYFKHSNMTSFVRQLNMYGFHKVMQVDPGLSKPDSQENCVEFQHERFQRDQPHLLSLIRRKVSVSRGVEEGGQISQVLVQVRHLRGWQDSSNLKLLALCRDNESLWRELDSLRHNYLQHHTIIHKIIKFIINSVQANSIKGCKRRLPMINNNREFQSSPKYTRSINVNSTCSASALQENPLLQELDMSAGDVYYSGVLSHLLDSTPEPNRGSVTESLPETFFPTSSTELTLSWMNDTALLESGGILSERNDLSDPLALIDSSLEALRTSPPAPDLDIFTKLLSAGYRTSAAEDSETESKARNRNELDAVCDQGRLEKAVDVEQECEDGEEFSDVLPSLLLLVQEASSLSFTTTTLPFSL